MNKTDHINSSLRLCFRIFAKSSFLCYYVKIITDSINERKMGYIAARVNLKAINIPIFHFQNSTVEFITSIEYRGFFI